MPKLAEASESSKERFQWKTAGATNQSQMECNSSDFNGDKVKQYEAVCRVMAIIYSYKDNPSYFGPPEIREPRRIGEHRTTTFPRDCLRNHFEFVNFERFWRKNSS